MCSSCLAAPSAHRALRNGHSVITEEMELPSQYKVSFVVPIPGGRATLAGIGRLNQRTMFAGLSVTSVSTLPFFSERVAKQLLAGLVDGNVQSVRSGMHLEVRSVKFEATPYVPLASRASLSHASGYDSGDGLV